MHPESIYVALPHKATSAWAPVFAEQIRDGVYRITDCRGEDAEVQFGKGVIVRCRPQMLAGRERLVAYERSQ